MPKAERFELHLNLNDPEEKELFDEMRSQSEGVYGEQGYYLKSRLTLGYVQLKREVDMIVGSADPVSAALTHLSKITDRQTYIAMKSLLMPILSGAIGTSEVLSVPDAGVSGVPVVADVAVVVPVEASAPKVAAEVAVIVEEPAIVSSEAPDNAVVAVPPSSVVEAGDNLPEPPVVIATEKKERPRRNWGSLADLAGKEGS